MTMNLLRSRPLIAIGLLLGAALVAFVVFRQSCDAASMHKAAVPLVSLSQAQVKSVPQLLSTHDQPDFRLREHADDCRAARQ